MAAFTAMGAEGRLCHFPLSRDYVFLNSFHFAVSRFVISLWNYRQNSHLLFDLKGL